MTIYYSFAPHVAFLLQEPSEKDLEGQPTFFVAHLKKSDIMVLNGTGVFVGETLAAGPQSAREIADTLSEVFEVDPAEILGDIQTFLDSMMSKDFLVSEEK